MRAMILLAAIAMSGCSAMSLSDPRTGTDPNRIEAAETERTRCAPQYRRSATGMEMTRPHGAEPMVEVVCDAES